MSVGIVRQDGRIFWGDCVSNLLQTSVALDLDVERIEKLVKPLLLQQSLRALRPLLVRLDSIREAAVESHTVVVAATTGISRRGFISGLMADETPQVHKEEVSIERPLSSSLCYGLGQALLTAVSHTYQCSPTTILAREYDLPETAVSLPTHGEIEEGSPELLDQFIIDQVNSIGYTSAGQQAKLQLGEQAQLLQRFVRQVKERIVATAVSGYRPTIHLNLRGAIGDLYGDQVGKILGALYGLEQAAHPYALSVEQPVNASQQALLEQLKQYLNFRKMSVQIGITAQNATDLTHWNHESLDFVHFHPLEWGSMEQLIHHIKACQAAGLGTRLTVDKDETPTSLETLVKIGLATQMDGLLTRSNLHRVQAYNQIQRYITQVAMIPMFRPYTQDGHQ